MKQYFTKEETTWFINNYRKIGAVGCAKHLNRSVFYMTKKAQNLGIKLTPQERKELKHKEFEITNNQKVDIKKFQNITQPEVAYFLGLLWSDGHVSKKKNVIIMSLNNKDYNCIVPIIKSIGHFHILENQRNNQFTMHLGHAQLHKYLTILDYQQKSLLSPTKILEVIPKNLHYLFWRGNFDGDGCLYINKSRKYGQMLSVCGSFNQDWTDWIKLGKEIGTPFKTIRRKCKNGMSSFIYCYDRYKIMDFIDYIYPNNQINIGLIRKQYKIKEFLNKYNFSHRFTLLPDAPINSAQPQV